MSENYLAFFGVALLCSLALLVGFGNYLFLWWLERRAYGIASACGLLAVVWLLGLCLFILYSAVTEGGWLFGFEALIISAALIQAAWIQGAKFQQPRTEAFFMLTAGIMGAFVCLPVNAAILGTLVDQTLRSDRDWLLAAIHLGFVLQLTGMLSGPLLWNHWARCYKAALHWRPNLTLPE